MYSQEPWLVCSEFLSPGRPPVNDPQSGYRLLDSSRIKGSSSVLPPRYPPLHGGPDY